jgi:CubicO group peptidase (beta-lactamase class C family)
MDSVLRPRPLDPSTPRPLLRLLAAAAVVLLGCSDQPRGSETDPSTSDGAGPGTGGGASVGTGSGPGGAGTGGPGGGGVVPDPELDAFLEAQLDAGHVPGMSAAVLRGGEVAWTGAYGMADVDAGRPVETGTLFELASISKTIVSVALMQLEEQGQISLDDDVGTLVPFDVRHPDYPSTPITLRMLVTHTSSIIDDWDTLDAGYTPGDAQTSLHDFLEGYLVPGGATFSASTNFSQVEPGSAFEYSNVAVTLAAYVVEVVSGEPFDAYCQEHVFAPLGMDETAWRMADLDPSHVAVPYEYQSGAFSSFGFYGYPDYPDGLLRTSAPQLGRFLSAFIHDGSLGGVKVLDASTAQAMRQPQVPEIEPSQAIIWYYEGGTLGHTGGDLGVATSMFYRPDDGAGVIFLLNADPAGDTWGAIEQRLWQKADQLASGDR